MLVVVAAAGWDSSSGWMGISPGVVVDRWSLPAVIVFLSTSEEEEAGKYVRLSSPWVADCGVGVKTSLPP